MKRLTRRCFCGNRHSFPAYEDLTEATEIFLDLWCVVFHGHHGTRDPFNICLRCGRRFNFVHMELPTTALFYEIDVEKMVQRQRLYHEPFDETVFRANVQRYNDNYWQGVP